MSKKFKALYEQSMLVNAGLIQENTRLRLNPQKYTPFNAKMYANMLSAEACALASNRYIWKNLPFNLTSQQLEALFYQYGALCFFAKDDELQVSKFALVGGLNWVGRLNKIKPISFDGEIQKTEMDVIGINGENAKTGAVVIYDYTTFTQAPDEMSRLTINTGSTITDEVEVYKQLRINIKLSIKKLLALCETEEQRNTILQQAESMLDSDYPIVALAASQKKNKNLTEMPVEQWNFDKTFDTQNYCQTIDFYGKKRNNFMGIPTPDTFEKKERKITGETEDARVKTDGVMDDGLSQRLNGLELIKKYVKAKGVDKITVEINPIYVKEKKEEIDYGEVGKDD